jgi:hypothetical protein
MAFINKAQLIAELSPPMDATLADQLVEEFASQEKRYIQSDWGPSQLDGGQFCEILSRIVYHLDSGVLAPSKDFNDACKYIENDSVSHAISPRGTALHIVRVMRTVYKFRSQRGAVHISPTYTPNHMDSRLVIENVRWLFNETVRLYWNGDRESAAKAIRETIRFEVPCVAKYDDRLLVQRTDLSAEEEILLLLFHAGEAGLSRGQLGQSALRSPSVISRALANLTSPSARQIIKLKNGNLRLTDPGIKRVREQLSDKLVAG